MLFEAELVSPCQVEGQAETSRRLLKDSIHLLLLSTTSRYKRVRLLAFILGRSIISY
jgi:hypothetical protein